MEKLLEFEKGKLWDENTKMYRFQCRCLSAGDAMDITVDSQGKNDEEKLFTICMDFVGTSFWGRLKYAFQILRGDWNWREFIIREEDCRNLSDILNPNKKFSELP